VRATIVPVTPFRQNCSVVWCERSGAGAVIDPGGDHAALIRSIRENLFPLGDDVRFVPGHGPMSTFGAERQANPFVGDRAVGAR
jgi:glyoxylase-like metal-dependent hydrolase (beta-lactamase superfamily II)